jgi:single-stranded-DNA-specific exonuclease
MKKIVDRIFLAIEKKEKILIFSDYDTDGIPGGSLLYKFFEKIKYGNFQNFIPNRNKDGYGLTKEKAEKIIGGNIFQDSLFGKKTELGSESENFKEKKGEPENFYENFLPSLIITIDCGITDIEAAKILKKNKIDLIITDHHLPKENLPDCFGILNHKVEGEKYPDKNLCGCGVIFKLVQAVIFENKNKNIFEKKEGWEK